MAKRLSYRRALFEQLDLIADRLRAGPVSFLLDPGVSIKTFSVYAQQWFEALASTKPNESLTIHTQDRYVTLTILDFRRKSTFRQVMVSHLEHAGTIRDAVAAAAGPIATPADLEVWAEFCLNTGNSLPDILEAAGGECPTYYPTSVEGEALLRAAALLRSTT